MTPGLNAMSDAATTANTVMELRAVFMGNFNPPGSLLLTFPQAALRAQIRSDAAKPAGFGGSKVKSENKVLPDLRRNPSGWGQFSRFRCRSSLADTRYASLLASRTRKNWIPALPTRKLITDSTAKLNFTSAHYSSVQPPPYPVGAAT